MNITKNVSVRGFIYVLPSRVQQHRLQNRVRSCWNCSRGYTWHRYIKSIVAKSLKSNQNFTYWTAINCVYHMCMHISWWRKRKSHFFMLIPSLGYDRNLMLHQRCNTVCYQKPWMKIKVKYQCSFLVWDKAVVLCNISDIYIVSVHNQKPWLSIKVKCLDV